MAHERRRIAEGRASVVEGPERCVGYGVYDPLGKKIGSVGKLFGNENHEPEYVRVKMGLFGMRSVLIPVGFVEVEEGRLALTLK